MRWSQASDAELLAATPAHGDAFAAFYDRYETAVVGYLLRRTRNVEVAVDLASEVFAAALTAADRYRPEAGSAAAWLFTIAHHTLADSLRRGQVEARARRRLGIRDAIAYAVDDLEQIERRADCDTWATELLAGLPADQREAIRARVIDERAYPDIALELRTSELVVRKRVSRGLAAMRQRMEEPT